MAVEGGHGMTAPELQIHGSVRVEVLDARGERLLGRGHLRLESATEGARAVARLDPDAGATFEAGPHVLRLPTGQAWEVDLAPREGGRVLGVVGVGIGAPSISVEGGGE